MVASFDVEFESQTAHTLFAMGYLVPENAVVSEPLDLTVGTDTPPEQRG